MGKGLFFALSSKKCYEKTLSLELLLSMRPTRRMANDPMKLPSNWVAVSECNFNVEIICIFCSQSFEIVIKFFFRFLYIISFIKINSCMTTLFMDLSTRVNLRLFGFEILSMKITK